MFARTRFGIIFTRVSKYDLPSNYNVNEIAIAIGLDNKLSCCVIGARDDHF